MKVTVLVLFYFKNSFAAIIFNRDLLSSSGLTRTSNTSDLPTGTDDEDRYLTFEAIVTKKGYPVETHSVTTEDGYILTLHRIPHGLDGPSENRPVVYLQHALLCSSIDWIILGPPKAIAYVLANAGYDVWLGNKRGTTVSKHHVKLDPNRDRAEFWNFSWDEIGYYDIPAFIDYALNYTGQSSLYHIGHSLGTTTFYVMASRRPEYNDKIKAHFSFSPVVYMSHMASPLFRVVAPFEKLATSFFKTLGIYKILPSNPGISELLCGVKSPMQPICEFVYFLTIGFNYQELNKTLLPIILAHTPAGGSIKENLHYGQLINSGKFRRWDYGPTKNLFEYGSSTPPDYDLNQITTRIYLFYSTNDWLSAVEDVNRLEKSLNNAIVHKILVKHPKWNHLDYVYAIHADYYVYNKVLSILADLEKNSKK